MTSDLSLLPPIAVFGELLACPFNAALAEALKVMQSRHPSVFERLAGLGDKLIRIEPRDLPVAFTLAVGPTADRPWLRVASSARAETAVIRGSFATLLDLLEGRRDGDGLFFARSLAVEGDMEIVVGLRNAVDGEDIDVVEDLFSVFGPVGLPLSAVARLLRRLVADQDATPEIRARL